MAERMIYVHDRRRVPLAQRAHFAWTFFGAGLFAAMILFLVGFYLLRRALFDPLAGSAPNIVGGGFTLALAGFLFLYVLQPRLKMLFVRKNEQRGARGLSVREWTIELESPDFRRGPAPGDSAPRVECDDDAHVRQ